MNITPGYGDYNTLKPIIGKYKKILVTGPHGAGNKITTDVIAHDFNLPRLRGEYPWKLDEYENENGLMTYHRDLYDQEWAMFAPSNSCHLHRIVEMLDDVLVVFMYKDINEIKSYSNRNQFLREQTYVYESLVYTQMVLEDFPEDDETLTMGIEELTYHIWETYQRDLIPNWIEIKHSSLEGHELWVSKDERKDFKSWQTRKDQVGYN